MRALRVAFAVCVTCALTIACSSFGVGPSAHEGSDAGGVDGDASYADGPADVSDGSSVVGDAGNSRPDAADARSFPVNTVFFDGHGYLLVIRAGGVTWSDADAAARNMGGHLATINSTAESTFVYDLLRGVDAVWNVESGVNHIGPWLGGFQPEGSPEPAGGWRWVTEEPFTHDGWHPGEPNDKPTPEAFVHYYGHLGRVNKWADGPDTTRVRGYVVEFE
jgi:hypothetical protein